MSSSLSTPPTEGAPLAPRVALENGLRSKLTGMENAIARVASVKSRLRKNAEQARRDLSLTISAQMEALRFREQQLIAELEEAVERKESVLATQQENLNLHIGACQQSLESLRRSSPSCTQQDVDVQEMLFRLSAVNMEPRANDFVALQADTLSMRGVIAEWGRIVEDGDERRESRRAGESLPVEMEEYDDSPLAHKSLMWSSHRKRGAEEGKKEKGAEANVGFAVRDWLEKNRPSAHQVLTADIGSVMEDVEQKSCGTSCDSTFEVIDPITAFKCPPRPLADWLPPVVERDLSEYWSRLNLDPPPFPSERSEQRTPTSTPTEQSSSGATVLPGLRTHPSLFEQPNSSSSPSSSTHPSLPSMLYQFESVIGKLMKSSDDEWLAPSSSSSMPPSVPSSSPSNPAPTPILMSHAEAMERLARDTEKLRMEWNESATDASPQSPSSPFVHPTATSAQSLPTHSASSTAPSEFATQWQRVFGRGEETSEQWLEAKSS